MNASFLFPHGLYFSTDAFELWGDVTVAIRDVMEEFK